MSQGADVAIVRVRAYAADPATGAARAVFLVDRLWPRGIAKADLALDGWVREVAPSDGLRRWFGHDPAKWGEFRRRYLAELKDNHAAAGPLLEALREGPVLLLFDAKDTEHNQAVVLREWLGRFRR